MTYEIEKNVPAPKRDVSRRKNQRKYPFEQMAIGDSFFVADNEQYHRVSSAMSQEGRRRGTQFTMSYVAGGGFRVWRVG